jgi:2-polyprenyl-3-methyl-5-hydroxy-6-metoxy-1,4-benzoquinol methylase
MSKTFVYDEVTWGKGDPKDYITPIIKDKSAVLDVGCGVGGFGAWLKKNKGATVVGFDGSKEAIDIAKTHLDAAEVVDLNDLAQVGKVLGTKKYDYITFIDVLEHCHYPKELLEMFKGALKSDGRIIVSLPNIAHYSARMHILKGNFDYQDSGLFDKTHVKFYTQKTSRELIESAGLVVEKTMHTSPDSGWKGALSKIDPTLTAIQFIRVARKA